MDDLGRREFMQAGTISLTALTSGSNLSLQQQDEPREEYDFSSAAHLIGPASARPTPGGSFFDNKTEYAYVYEDLNGQRALLTETDAQWRPLNYLNQVNVFTQDDLPAPVNGRHPLVDNTVYRFYGFVTSPYGLELGTATPLVGRHGSADGFIHTGTNTALYADGAGFFARDIYFHAPGGTLFDLTADQTTEFLVESCSFSDAAGIGQIASLGTITGYRVPSLKGCNFEDFASGLTFDGNPDKIFIEGSPFRGVTASGVTILTFASTLDVDIVDMPDNYVKGVQPDTEMVRVETGATPDLIFQYRGTTHDETVTTANILTGEAGVRNVGYRVTDCYPLANSGLSGDLDLDSPYEVTGSGAAPTQITGPTTLNNPERTIEASDGVIEYVGRQPRNVTAHGNVVVSGGNTQFALWIAKNGSIVPRSRVEGFLPNASAATTIVSISQLELVLGDTVSVFLENIGGTADLTAETLALTV